MLGDDLSDDISDESVFRRSTSSAGFSIPLLVPPQPRFMGASAMEKEWSWKKDRAFRPSVKDPELQRLFDELYLLPPVAVSYWRSLNDDGVHRVDLLAGSLGAKVSAGEQNAFKFAEDLVEPAKSVFAVLNAMSSNSFSIDPLIHADVAVKLDRSLFKAAYEPVILEALKNAGFDIDMRRRALRDMVMRGY
jgi:hypothetical protein